MCPHVLCLSQNEKRPGRGSPGRLNPPGVRPPGAVHPVDLAMSPNFRQIAGT